MSGPRVLLYFPILHTEADMGALRDAVQRMTVRKVGRRGWARTRQLVDELWEGIERAIAGLDLCWQRVRVYQDGLPECGRELEIVAELAQAHSRNHELLWRLHQHGATLMGTESPDLLMTEYRFARETLASPNRAAPQKAARDALLAQRDRHIAARINSTLRRGETGILFLGALHSAVGLLDKDIRVVCPLEAKV